jgi:hypothetical protein
MAAIIFTITAAGLNAALDAANTGFSLQMTELSGHDASGTEIGRWPLGGGIVEPNSNVMHFHAVLKSSTQKAIYGLKLWADDVVFATAQRVDPLVVIDANIDFAASFAMAMAQIPTEAITISTDINTPYAQILMTQHLGAVNPHPQYALDAQNAFEHANLVTLIAGVVQALQQHENALNPHPQYAFASEINPRQLFRLTHNIGTPYATHFGRAAGSVTHELEGSTYSLGNCLNDYNPIYVEPVSDYVIEDITLGQNLNRQGYLLRFDGYIQFGSYAGQGDTGFSTPTAKIRFFDESFEFLLEVPLTLSLITSGFPNNGNVGHVMYRASKDFDLYKLRKSNGQPPNNLRALLAVQGVSDSDGGSTDLQILTVEGFSILCSY